jgi:hypothetical protein
VEPPTSVVPLSPRWNVADDQLISEGRMVDDLVPRPGRRLSQPAHVSRTASAAAVRFVIEFDLDSVVVDHVTSMSIEEGE